MHGEHAVKDFRRNEVVMGMHQLNADDECFDAANYKEQQSRGNVENSQPFVIDSG